MFLKNCLLICFLALLISGCSTRGLNDQFASATEQRLVTQSLDKLVSSLPEKDFQDLRGQSVYLQAYFIEQPAHPEIYKPESTILNFAQQRIKLELLEKYSCSFVETSDEADYQLHFFFNAIGSDQDSLGLSLPPLALPGMGVSQIDIIAVEMFHGVSEGYYFIVNNDQAKTVRGKLLKARVRTDNLKLPIISIPLNTLD